MEPYQVGASCAEPRRMDCWWGTVLPAGSGPAGTRHLADALPQASAQNAGSADTRPHTGTSHRDSPGLPAKGADGRS